jgi:hypothetical protein
MSSVTTTAIAAATSRHRSLGECRIRFVEELSRASRERAVTKSLVYRHLYRKRRIYFRIKINERGSHTISSTSFTIRASLTMIAL